MKKYLLIFMVGLCGINQVAYSEEIQGMTFENLLEEAKTDIIFQKQSKDRITLLDINNDGIISYNEISNAATGVAEIPESIADDEQKDEMKGYFLDAFEECDKDLNNELTGQEIDEFVEKMRYFFLKQRFESMDKNNDGIIGVDDMPTAEEATQQLEEAMEKMQATVEKIDKMDSNTIAEGWIKSIGAAVADEDFYQMDRDRNGCLSREEYVHYQMETDNSSEEDGAVKMTALDYTRWYLNIKKSQKDCLTKEEYIADQNLPIEKKLEEVDNEENEKIYAGILFEEIDTDSSEKITAEEYAEYNYQRDKNLYAPNEPVMKKEDYYNSFMRIMAPDKGWMNKEEFIEGYIKERVKNKEEFSEEDLEEIENEDKIETEEEVKGEENAKEE